MHEVRAAGCWAYVPRGDHDAVLCPAEPTIAGAVFERDAAWLVFACDAHVTGLVAPRRLLDRDHRALQKRRDGRRSRRAAVVTPLARGRDAQQLMVRARAWERRNPLPPARRPSWSTTRTTRDPL